MQEFLPSLIDTIPKIKEMFPEIKLIIEYDPVEGKPIADDVIGIEYAFILDALKTMPIPVVLSYSNEIMITKTRFLIINQILKPEEMVYYFAPTNQVLAINNYAVLDSYPSGFCDIHIKLLEKLLTFQCDTRKKNRRKEKV